MNITLTIPDTAIDAIIPTGNELRCWPRDSEVQERIAWLAQRLGESLSWCEQDITMQIIEEVKQRTHARKRHESQ